jgi:hypothetical protein
VKRSNQPHQVHRHACPSRTRQAPPHPSIRRDPHCRDPRRRDLDVHHERLERLRNSEGAQPCQQRAIGRREGSHPQQVTWRAFTSHVDVVCFRKILKQISKTRKFLLTLKLSSAPDVQRLRSQGRDPAIPVIPPGPGRSPARAGSIQESSDTELHHGKERRLEGNVSSRSFSKRQARQRGAETGAEKEMSFARSFPINLPRGLRASSLLGAVVSMALSSGLLWTNAATAQTPQTPAPATNQCWDANSGELRDKASPTISKETKEPAPGRDQSAREAKAAPLSGNAAGSGRPAQQNAVRPPGVTDC